ncbi:MAG: polymer-forming cytoskeletal protein [Thermoanaerobaculales bacterium]|nr:polymer-forming cytoskeletal protein [Thermoanaerobaculales bacterium]
MSQNPNAPTAPGAGPPAKTASSPSSPSGRDQATIGRSINIRGDVTGDEDLLIQGRIEGTVDLKQHSVTIGPEGRVKADLKGRRVTVEGEVEGDVRGQEQVVLKASSTVNGDIVAPRVVLEDGATFLGSIDMSGKAPAGAAATAPNRSAKSMAEGDATTSGKTNESKPGAASN